ncbi:oligoendopeptidase F [Mageeibacillus indolicus]|uniref:Oligopeptidase F n=1 Tax=Mageeibacillus indolicus TaxID=884684 RepID=A0A2J8B4K6_9FIRM|nr:oligoendopeptidase F [Mageeibacillus indolicus]PNH19703.1 oligoendopeptidase F [Mageeibacillus indolicus]
MTNLPLRSEVPVNDKWDLTLLYSDENAYRQDIDALTVLIKKFLSTRPEWTDYHNIIHNIPEYENILSKMYKISSYAQLNLSTDYTDEKLQNLADECNLLMAHAYTELAAFDASINNLSVDDLQACIKEDGKRAFFWRKVLENKSHTLEPAVEKALTALQPALDFPYNLYSLVKQTDLNFHCFTTGGQKLPLDFVTFENKYQYDPDTECRRAAFAAFSEDLRQVGNTFASAYNARVQNEKIIADLRHYNSIFDYLLQKQQVTAEMYHRQIDIIMRDLAPIMRRYAKLLKRVHGWDKITYADLHVPLDPSFTPSVTREEANKYVESALKIMGEDYSKVVHKALTERWVDFACNRGKSTGGFCATPINCNSFILLSWNKQLSDVFTLAHELGHALHFHYVNENQTYLGFEPSAYLIEAPSTCNEVLFSFSLLSESNNLRFRRWVLSTMLSNTYYHNFVTHLLEAAFQRKVYLAVDRGENLGFNALCQLMKDTLTEFWGDTVELTLGAELTWMRQPHYYMGLYSYTYSAGLTLGTIIAKRIYTEGKAAVDDWKTMLKAGGTLPPLELARLAKVDLSTAQPLEEVINYLSDIVDELESLTAEME